MRSMWPDLKRVQEEPGRDDQSTPKWLMGGVHRFFGSTERESCITIDYCSNKWAIDLGFVRARIAWTIEDDCLAQAPGSWAPNGARTNAWFQPAYSGPGPFVDRLIEEWTSQPFRCIGLVKGDWTTKWWAKIEEHATAIGTPMCRVHHHHGYELRKSTDFASLMFYLHNGDRVGSHPIDAVSRLEWAFAPQPNYEPKQRVRWWPSMRTTRSIRNYGQLLAFVYRQQHDGSHEQDRHDARMWMEAHADGMCTCPRCKADEKLFREKN